MPSSAEERSLRDILFHIDLAAEFVAGFDRDTFKAIFARYMRSHVA
jgi:hypothetical protein